MGATFLVIGMVCMFVAGFAGGRGWRIWGDELEIEPNTVTLTTLLLILGLASFVTGVSL